MRSWLKKIGDTVAINDPLVELETDKVTQEVPSPAAGVLTEILLDTDAEALPGALLGRLGVAQAAQPAPVAAPVEAPRPAPVPPQPTGERNTALSPAVRRAVKEAAIDPARIEGTGRNGRITRADVDRAVATRDQAPAEPVPTPVPQRIAAPPSPAPVSGAVQSIPHNRMRLAIAENMLNSVTVAPHVTAVFEADFSAIMAHRRKHKATFEKDGIGLTFTAYFIAACVEAMRAAPAINSRWYDDRLDIFGDVNIGIGTALGDKGLVVPVVHKAQELSLRGIAARLGELTAKARGDRLQPADMRGGTFTISNHGVSGSLVAIPIIISQPQSAILGVGKLEKRVVVREVGGVDTIQIRPMAYVSLTIDHRVVDGHQTNAWLSRFVDVIDNWPLES
ncbi:2-oxo acid dehydrogenase subunit E2 [Sphingomonas naphthae]|uniref:Dihydrolipoamide acetyltransferase component of pyruvate dehydrogenase complex n=1 Tax=Sphingomonas naphthae TaxID=1813468 RepID=A0ABY7TMU0_9SPHN|nr:2-oxo acid dehydrogenase subunit E2 [Sphingomonas naphthae]WCT74494.1 2-oxo acid dehydrogenase subunit E2 [Sphingomonas naphthae]